MAAVSVKRSIINLVTRKHVKQRQSVNEDVFEAGVLITSIGMFAPKWAPRPHKLARFSLLGPLHQPWELSVVLCFAIIRSLSYAFMPREVIYFRFLFCAVLSSLSIPPPEPTAGGENLAPPA